MTTMISYGIGYTADSVAGTTLTIQPPPIYAAGDTLVMGVIAGGSSGAVAAALVSGWTQQSANGAALAVFTKTATGSESAYTVTLGATACAAGYVAAYPPATIASYTPGNSSASVASWSATFPTGVTAGQIVLMAAGTVAASYQSDSASYDNSTANLNLPAGWTPDVPVFGPVLASEPASSVVPCAIGLAEVTGTASNPALTTPALGELYAGFLVLTVTGSPPPSYTVTATSTGATAYPGIALTVKQLTGTQSAAQIITAGATLSAYAGGTSTPPEMAFTPNATGSVVYAALTENYGATPGSTYTAYTGTTLIQNVADTVNSAIYGTLRYTGTTTGGTGITLGASAPSNAYLVGAVAEILAAPGQTITEVATATVSATQPGQYPTTAASQTAVFTTAPAPGMLLVAMVSANSQYWQGNASFTISDSYGLTWTRLASEAYPGYAGVFIAQVPAAVAATPPLLPPGMSNPAAWQFVPAPGQDPSFPAKQAQLTDAAGAADSFIASAYQLADTAAGTDGIVAFIGPPLPDAAAATDAITATVTAPATDAAGAVDTATADFTVSDTVPLHETAAAADGISVTIIYHTAQYTDTAAATDQFTASAPPGPPLLWMPPSVGDGNVLWGTGLIFTATTGTSLPADQNLGLATAWLALGWAYVGATVDGVTMDYQPTTQVIAYEGMSLPGQIGVTSATLTVTANLSEETMTSINLAYGNGGTVTTTTAGAGQPGKQVLSLSEARPVMAVAVLGRNEYGYARLLSLPQVYSIGEVSTAWRRATGQRVYPLTLNATGKLSGVQWADLTNPATS